MTFFKILFLLNFSEGWNKVEEWCQKCLELKDDYEEYQVCIYPTPPPKAGCDTRSIFKQSKAGFNFPLPSPIKAEEPSLLNYLHLAGARKDGFMPFPRASVRHEMQTTLSRIWSWVADFTSDNNNCNKMCLKYTSNIMYIFTQPLYYEVDVT